MRARGALVVIERLGRVTLACVAILLVTFLAVPAVDVTAFSFTLWEFAGIDPAHPLAGSSAGVFSILGLSAILAPLAMAFARPQAVRWLCVGPLVYAAALVGRVYFGIESGARSVAGGAAVLGPTAARLAHDLEDAAVRAAFDAIHPSFGAYLFAFNALVLATQVFYRPRRA